LETRPRMSIMNPAAPTSLQQGTASPKMRKRILSLLLTFAIIAVSIPPAGASPAPTALPQSTPAASTTHKSSATSGKKKKSTHRHSSKREPFQKAPTADRVSEIQTALSRGGYFEGSPNGKWDSNTVAAMQKFQSANGLNASGKIDATTLQKLGLGSSTAGLNAPKPPKKADPSATTAAARPASPPNANSASNVTPTPTPASSPVATKPPQR
jgi:peptidoglycan hydrolase-like protein with peptidoglycan-binding domain